jgi:hypothetical protein
MYQMAKAYYDVTYKTYYNDRIKPVPFRGKETHPLYVQVTFDRRTIFLKSYYFELFRQKKYDVQGSTLVQIEVLEESVIGDIIARNINRFNLKLLLDEYKVYSADVLDALERPFMEWLAGCLRADHLPGLAAMVTQGTEEVWAIQLWDDLKTSLQPDLFSAIEERAIREAPPYYLLSAYVRDRYPRGPFCLPFHEWVVQENQLAMKSFLKQTFWQVEMGLVDFQEVIRTVSKLMFRHPKR